MTRRLPGDPPGAERVCWWDFRSIPEGWTLEIPWVDPGGPGARPSVPAQAEALAVRGLTVDSFGRVVLDLPTHAALLAELDFEGPPWAALDALDAMTARQAAGDLEGALQESVLLRDHAPGWSEGRRRRLHLLLHGARDADAAEADLDSIPGGTLPPDELRRERQTLSLLRDDWTAYAQAQAEMIAAPMAKIAIPPGTVPYSSQTKGKKRANPKKNPSARRRRPSMLPIVDLPGSQASHDQTYQQIHDIFVAAEPLTFFVTEDGKCLVEVGTGGMEQVTSARFAAAVGRWMRFQRQGKDEANFHELPEQTAKRMLKYLPAGWWPVLRGVAHHPLLLPDGRLLKDPGYDSASGWFLNWACPPIDTASVTPTTASWVWARLLDYVFPDGSSYYSAMAMFIQPYVRPAISGPTPLYLVGSDGVDAAGSVAGSGAGKTCLPQTVGYAVLGREPPMLNPSAWPSEFERQLHGLLATEPEMLLLDNVATGSVLGGSLLHQVLTAREGTIVRVVGEAPREVRIHALWVATGNGLLLDGEQIRRTVPIQLCPSRDLSVRPYLTRDLIEWVRDPATRALIASVICRAIEDWIAAGRPTPPRTLPSFNSWSDVVGGIVCNIGGESAREWWLAPSARPRPAIVDEWIRLFEAWPLDTWGGKKNLSSTAVLALLDEVPCPTIEAAVRKSKNDRAQVSAMGRLLAGRVGISSGPWTLVTGTSSGKATWYRPDRIPTPPLEAGVMVTVSGGIGRDQAISDPSAESEAASGSEGQAGQEGQGEGRVWSGVPSDAVVVEGTPSGPSGPSGPATTRVPTEGSDDNAIPHVPPDTEQWREEVEALEARGVRIDPVLWATAVREFRDAEVAATMEAVDPAQESESFHRLVALDSYAIQVQAQAELDPDHRVRATWNPEGTWTGRITAKGPPLQSITKKGGLRGAVVPPPGCSFVVGDWKQSQIRIAFGLSGDPAGAMACAPGRDVHAEIGAAVAPRHLRRRDLGKLLNFAILYLAGPDRLVRGATDLGIPLSRRAARNLIEKMSEAYSTLCKWRREQEGLERFSVGWGGGEHRPVELPPSAFDPSTGTPRLPAVLAGIMQSLEVEALRHVLNRTEELLGLPFGYRPALLVHDEIVWEGPISNAEAARIAAEELMVEALGGVTCGVPALASVEIRVSWARAGS